MVDDIFGVGILCDERVNKSSDHTQPTEMLDDSYKGPNQDDQFSSPEEEARHKKKKIAEKNYILVAPISRSCPPCCAYFILNVCMADLLNLSLKFRNFSLKHFSLMNSFPSTCYEASKLTKELGLGYEKIHVCLKDCMLYWRENSEHESCINCGLLRSQTSEVKRRRHNAYCNSQGPVNLQKFYSIFHLFRD